MTGNGIESDFVLPDSLFISDYSTLPAFYPHFGANCRFFCTISMSPDSSALFPSRTLPEALPLDSAKGSSTLWTPVRAIQLSAFSCYPRVLIRERHQCRPKPPPNPFEFPTTVLLCVTVALVEPIVTVYVSPTTKSGLENTTLFALFTVTPVYSTFP